MEGARREETSSPHPPARKESAVLPISQIRHHSPSRCFGELGVRRGQSDVLELRHSAEWCGLWGHIF